MSEENNDATKTEEARFKKWKQKVDIEVAKLCGMGCDDLPDVDYWSMFEAGDSPIEAAEQVLNDAM